MTDKDEHLIYVGRARHAGALVSTLKANIIELHRRAGDASTQAAKIGAHVDDLISAIEGGDQDKAFEAIKAIDDQHDALRDELAACRKAAGRASDHLTTARGQVPSMLHVDRLFPDPDAPKPEKKVTLFD